MMNGWANFGAALAGAGGGQQAEMRGEAMAYDLDAKRMRARKEREESMARAQYADVLAGMGVDPSQAKGIATIMQGGNNPAQAMQALQTQQGTGMQSELWNRINGGQNPAEWGGLNQALAVLSGKPAQVTGESGGTLYNRLVDPAGQAPVTTAVGQSQIAQRMAAAEASKATALQRGAQARLAGVKADAGGFAPRSAGGDSKIDYRMLDLLLTEDKGGIAYPDPAAQGEFLEWQAQQTDPRMQDMRTAVAEFKKQRNPGMGQFFDGSGAVPQRVDLSPSVAGAAQAPRARNPKTGEVLELRNGQWVPAQ